MGDTAFFFSAIFPTIILKAHFIIKFHVEIKECFDFFSSFSQTEREPFHRTVQLPLSASGVTSQFRAPGEALGEGRTSISVQVMTLESNFQSFLNFFYCNLNGLLYSFAVGSFH